MALTTFLALGAMNTRRVLAGDYHGLELSGLVGHYELEEVEIQAILDAIEDEHQDNAFERRLESIDQLLIEGKITKEQKEFILSEFERLDSKKEMISRLPEEERSEAIDSLKTEFKNFIEKLELDPNIFVLRSRSQR